jgi:uncharacterized protein YbbK (DUF523 family)
MSNLPRVEVPALAKRPFYVLQTTGSDAASHAYTKSAIQPMAEQAEQQEFCMKEGSPSCDFSRIFIRIGY